MTFASPNIIFNVFQQTFQDVPLFSGKQIWKLKKKQTVMIMRVVFVAGDQNVCIFLLDQNHSVFCCASSCFVKVSRKIDSKAVGRPACSPICAFSQIYVT